MFSLPTLHPATTHFPIALLALSSLSGLLYLYWQPRIELRILTWWPMLSGWLSGVVAALTGLLAQINLPPQSPYGNILNMHISTALALLIVYATLLYRKWLFHTRRTSRKRSPVESSHADLLDIPNARFWLTGLLIVGGLLIFVNGWYGGQLVYEWGVNVNSEQ